MNSFLISLQRFLKNKNTVTIIGVILIIGILYFGYRTQIQNAVNPVRNIPVARQTIQPREEITKDKIEHIDVAPIMLTDDVYRVDAQVIGKYSNYNTLIPKGSMFFKGAVVNKNDLPDSAFVEVEPGEVVYNFPVTLDSTYGNSIFPGNYIDIYMKAENDAGQVMVGKLLENVKVLDVKDRNGKHVFENTEEDRVPTTLIFGLKDELNILMRKASYMKKHSVVLFPVPHGGSVPTEGTTQVSTQYLKDFINANTVNITEENPTNPDSSTTGAGA